MTKEERIEMIIEYARKVVVYPKGDKGYDPADLINLQYAIEKYDRENDNIVTDKDGMTYNTKNMHKVNDHMQEAIKKIVYSHPKEIKELDSEWRERFKDALHSRGGFIGEVKIEHDKNCTHGMFIGSLDYDGDERLEILSPSFHLSQEDEKNVD